MSSILIQQKKETLPFSLEELERLFQISYTSKILFQKSSLQFSILKKTKKYHKKGFLTEQQLWLGAYFKKELEEAAIPPIYLAPVDDTVGWGVFAAKTLPPMTYLGEYTGTVRKYRFRDRYNSYCFEYPLISGESSRYTIDAQKTGNLCRFLNHSDRPNLSSALVTIDDLPHIIFFTPKEVREGTQLCYDYGENYWKKRVKPKVL